MEIIDGLNDVQKQALLETEGAVLVSAGAGSGKTRLLTHRIAHLIKNLGVKDEEILAITYTNKAANEMRERVDKILGHSNNIWVSTFHAMCAKILRQNIHHLQGFNANFTIYNDSDSEKLLKQVIKDLKLEDNDYKKYAFHISNAKNNNKEISQYALYCGDDSEEIIKVYDSYQEKLKQSNALDFDDLLAKTYELFATVPQVLAYYANRFRYVLVDEFQDTNTVQYDLVKMLTSVHKNVFVVGDEDQCIYTWRGANFRNILGFKNDFQNVKVFKLEQNYRSTKSILNLANKVIQNNDERLDKKLWTKNDEGKSVEYYQQYDEQTEAEAVASKIYALVKNGYKYSDMAILMRLNALTLPFEQKLLAYNIPHKIYGGFKFYERQEIKNIIAYLRLFTNPKDEVSFLRIINFPKRGIGDGAIEKLKAFAIEKNQTLLEATILLSENPEQAPALASKFMPFAKAYIDLNKCLDNEQLEDFVKQVVDKFNIKSAYAKESGDDDDKILNIDAFIGSIKQFTDQNPGVSLSDYLESITLESDIDHMDESDNVTLATIHAVKGLEFKVVFIVGLEEGIFPISRAFNLKKDMEEERRLMYVAMTRAEQRLFLSSCQTRYLYGKRSYMTQSRFVEESGLKKDKKPESNLYSSVATYSSYMPKPNIIKPTSSYTQTTSASTKFYEEEDKKTENVGKYKKGQKVSHPKFGNGEILDIVDDGQCADIKFENFGVKTLILEIAPLKILD